MKNLIMDDHGRLKFFGTVLLGCLFIRGFIALTIMVG